jgi:hypothetical protein
MPQPGGRIIDTYVVRTSLTTHQVKDAEMASQSLPDGYTLFDAVELLLKSHTSLLQ